MTTYVSVCKNTILSNIKHGTSKPPIRITVGLHGKPRRKQTFEFKGKGRIVYSPNKPAPWGARVWIEID